MLLRTRIYIDEAFIARFLCAIDDRIYQWLKQCSINQMVTDTDLTLVDFSSMIADIQVNRFVYSLPPIIAKLITNDKGERKRQVGSGSGPYSKEKVSTVKNSNIVQEWRLRPNET